MMLTCNLCISGVESYTLRVRAQPGRALGGQPFLEQPQVEILEGAGGDIDVFFKVSVASRHSNVHSVLRPRSFTGPSRG